MIAWARDGGAVPPQLKEHAREKGWAVIVREVMPEWAPSYQVGTAGNVSAETEKVTIGEYLPAV
ncbi:Hypothetical protein DEACI_3737 [Acididesulfobacillus acetoxydans]|uniref:Uncharacterized protein n=1 Tax=Acididesulfobacillus acetoxydans TaxID=1561005 RepID=A0A8S0WQX0_9FIRM|nr:hypothetical protein [Acididesulfobacillus acetoxydans]CAA7602914.1 Hypothetical protein DEACI_3737 [Acididesulfobacillus acetoxydans]CEJ05796.1 Hypothetical protein DEACI_0216 [Acididesulfobacillus acetoxydans]